MRSAVLTTLLSVAAARATTDITVYHINPAAYGAAPINMDTGDVDGDSEFAAAATARAPLSFFRHL